MLLDKMYSGFIVQCSGMYRHLHEDNEVGRRTKRRVAESQGRRVGGTRAGGLSLESQEEGG